MPLKPISVVFTGVFFLHQVKKKKKKEKNIKEFKSRGKRLKRKRNVDISFYI